MLIIFTNCYQEAAPYKRTMGLAGGDAYQSLPGSLLAVRNGMVVLVWSAGGLPTLTNTGLQTKSTMSQGGSDAYQTLPDPVLAERIASVILDWSTNAYHSPDLAGPPL